MQPTIDLNCDLGEGCASDAAVLPLISSASIACGLHAGDAATMRRTVLACLEHNVAIGAHPSFDDRAHFGRRDLQIGSDDLRALLRYQLGALAAIVQAEGGRLRHVKPHGALYNLSARDPAVAAVIADEVARFDPSLRLVGLAGSASIEAARARGLCVVNEVFAERRYEANGLLTPRDQPGAVIESVEASLTQVDQLLQGRVCTRACETIAVHADSICLHGDRPDVLDFARALNTLFVRRGVQRRAPSAEAAG